MRASSHWHLDGIARALRIANRHQVADEVEDLKAQLRGDGQSGPQLTTYNFPHCRKHTSANHVAAHRPD